ncbi:hypothetical protein H4O14_03340 [Bacillus sp. PAMC26568]|nr:hypothetical protein H4O14_03340 [Bacillus sp. PAMC26568]
MKIKRTNSIIKASFLQKRDALSKKKALFLKISSRHPGIQASSQRRFNLNLGSFHKGGNPRVQLITKNNNQCEKTA